MTNDDTVNIHSGQVTTDTVVKCLTAVCEVPESNFT